MEGGTGALTLLLLAVGHTYLCLGLGLSLLPTCLREEEKILLDILTFLLEGACRYSLDCACAEKKKKGFPGALSGLEEGVVLLPLPWEDILGACPSRACMAC